MADPARARRMAKRIAAIVANGIELEIKDTRLDFVTVTDVKVTNDLHDATVFYTVMGKTLDTPADIEGAALALEQFRGQLRSMVGAGTGVRYTPTLKFVLDTVPETVASMEALLAKARASDAAVAAARANAQPAGDPNPYKTDVVIESDDDDAAVNGAIAADSDPNESGNPAS